MLLEAIKKTLQNRKTEYNKESFAQILELAENHDIQVRWRYFQKTINQTGLSLSEVMRLIDDFLSPVFASLVYGEDFAKKWNTKSQRWGN